MVQDGIAHEAKILSEQADKAVWSPQNERQY